VGRYRDFTAVSARPGVSELEELGARREDTFLRCAEINEHSDIILDPDDRAEAVPVVINPIL
jgi:hypothetical protein